MSYVITFVAGMIIGVILMAMCAAAGRKDKEN